MCCQHSSRIFYSSFFISFPLFQKVVSEKRKTLGIISIYEKIPNVSTFFLCDCSLCDCSGVLLLAYGVGQFADVLDLALDDVPFAHEAGRLKAHSYSSRRAHGYYGARQKRDALAEF